MKWLKNFLANVSGKRHWYQIKIEFVKDGIRIGNTDKRIGFLLRDKILNRRIIMKAFGSSLGIYEDKRLHGCELQYSVICYIGWLKGNYA